MKFANTILDLIGNTPLVRLHRVVPPDRWVLAKLESMNPGGSVKDRIGIAMIERAERAGWIRPGATIVEPTSGNTGVGLALVCALKGYRLICVMPDKVPKEKVELLRAYGAECVLCPTDVPPDDERSYYRTAERLVREIPNAYMPQQYFNPANPEAHYQTTGPEIWRQTDGRVTHFVAGMGTGGTITGVARYLKEQNPTIRIIGVDPVGSVYGPYFRTGQMVPPRPYLIDGIGEDFIPETIDFRYIDEVITVSDRDAYQMTLRLAREEAILCGNSSGAAVWAAAQIAARASPDDVIVVLLPDTGERYLSKFSVEWLRAHGLEDV